MAAVPRAQPYTHSRSGSKKKKKVANNQGKPASCFLVCDPFCLANRLAFDLVAHLLISFTGIC
jgi:hypothetical protein